MIASLAKADVNQRAARIVLTAHHPGDTILTPSLWPSRSIQSALALLAAGLLVACATPTETANEVLARASNAMGSAELKTLRYSCEGEGFSFGQAYVPGGPWPKVAYPSITRTIDYDNAAMRDDVVLSRAEPRGGGGYLLSGQQRNHQFLSGEFA